MSFLVRRPARRALVALAALVFGTVGVATATPSRAVDLVDVTVTITRFIQVQNPDPGPAQGCCGDYVGEVAIDGFPSQSSPEATDTADVSPFWRFTRQVDRSLGTVGVAIRVRDVDTALAAPDDVMDLNPVDELRDLQLVFDMRTGSWSGDVPTNVGFSVGDGDHEYAGLLEGGEAGKVFFDIAVGDDDLDGDGIPDGVERFGVRDSNGNVTTDMAALGANPCRKTVALEVDWMQGAADGHTHKPQPLAVTEAKAAFAAAPVPAVTPCPYPGFSTATGMDLVLDLSGGIPEQPVLGLGSDFAAVRDASFSPDRRPYFHYLVFVHDQAAGTSSSGLCCNGKDYIVSLGSWRTTCVGAGADGALATAVTGDDVVKGTSIDSGPDRTCDSTATGDDVQVVAVTGGASDYEVGTARDQSGSILHELGHALSLGHGGDSGTNFKPTYLSVMNYAFDPGGIPVPGGSRLDYSREALPTVLETALSESPGVGSPRAELTTWNDATGAAQVARADAATVDWSGNGTISATTLPTPIDLNGDATCVSAGTNGTRQTSPAGDDVVVGTSVLDGPDRTCQTAKAGDDSQDRAVGDVQVDALNGWDDWANLRLQAGFLGVTGGAPHGPDITFPEAYAHEQVFAAALDPDLQLTKTVDAATTEPGATLHYGLTPRNTGSGDATQVSVRDTLPDGTVQVLPVGTVTAGGSRAVSTSWLVPCTTADGTTVTNRAVVSGADLLGDPEQDVSDNSASAATVVRAPHLVLTATTTAAQAGEASTVVLSYLNDGGAAVQGLTLTDTLSRDTYYSTALDTGAGPRPTTVVRNTDGTTRLTWQLGNLAAGGTGSVTFTVRSSLLLRPGDLLQGAITLDAVFGTGCTLPTQTAATSGAVLPSTATRDPLSQGYWGTHLATAELLARVQATDQRADTDGNGLLTPAEQAAAFTGSGTVRTLEQQELAVYLNLADRRVVAATRIASRTATALGLRDVADAARYAQATLALPLSGATRARYSSSTQVLDEINLGRSERW